MRTNILLLSAAILLGACADDQHATAPASAPSAASRSVSPDAPPGPNARPNDQTGWTTAVTVYSTPHAVAPNSASFATATCPAGTTLVGGGFSLDLGSGVAPAIYLNNPGLGATGWNAGARNYNPVGGSYVSITAYARCAS
jgi:hypothetical protein